MNKSKTLTMVTLGILIAIQIVLSRFCSINAWNIKIGFGFVPIAIAGILYGPVPAMLVGGLSDFLGAVLFPIGPYFPGFTLTTALTGMAFGLFLHKKRGMIQILLAVSVNQLILGLFLNTLWISILYQSPYLPLFLTRIIQCAILTPVECLVLFVMTKPILYYEKRLTA